MAAAIARVDEVDEQLMDRLGRGYLERDAWLRCMHTAVASIDSQTLDDSHRRALLDYLEMAADSMVNSAF